MLVEIGSVVLGWTVGANDGSTLAAPTVGARVLRASSAGLLVAGCVVLGAVVHGAAGVGTFARLGGDMPEAAGPAAVAAVFTVMLLLAAGLPGSVTQCVGGAIAGTAWAYGGGRLSGAGTVLLAWIASPICGGLAAAGILIIASRIVRRFRPPLFLLDGATRPFLFLATAGAAYALGANNAATAGAAFAQSGILNAHGAAVAGGVLIAVGAVFPNRAVLRKVGAGIVLLQSLSAACVLMAVAMVVFAFALLGKPVSVSQTLVGGIVGVGMVRGLHTIRWDRLGRLAAAWVAAPFFAGLVGFTVAQLLRLWSGLPA